jgi:hypothetical protein
MGGVWRRGIFEENYNKFLNYNTLNVLVIIINTVMCK